MGAEEHADPALQVIVLGSGGGPQESNTTAFLVRAVAQEWSKYSIVAVDAGVHLSAITRLIENSLPVPRPEAAPFTLASGPFAGLKLPHLSPAANAAYITRSLVDTYLITHPHLDHISGFVVNTAGLPGTRSKKLAGLPSTIQAFKSHIFNNVIWPNLSDENNGAGLVTYLRLVEGGSPALGDGEGRGYIEVCDGLLVKTWGVSHGHCIEKHSHRGSASSASTKLGSYDASIQTPRRDTSHQISSSHAMTRRQSLLGHATLGNSGSPQADKGAYGSGAPAGPGGSEQDRFCVYDSSAYFIRDQAHRREVLIFGDVEPDSISLSPRNRVIWQEAAPKILSGMLAAIFIECSYNDSQSNDRLFGHLKPCFIIEELQMLAHEVEVAAHLLSERQKEVPSTASPLASRQFVDPSKKRKRQQSMTQAAPRKSVSSMNAGREGGLEGEVGGSSTMTPGLEDAPVSPKTVHMEQRERLDTPQLATPTNELTLTDVEKSLDPASSNTTAATLSVADRGRKPLQGLKVVIIHVKESLADGPETGVTILQELTEYEREVQLGCEFVVSKPGQSFYF